MPQFQRTCIYTAVILALAHILSSSALAQQTNAVAQQPNAVVQTEDISVFGSGEVRQVQNISKEDLQKAPPGSNPLKVLEKLPGVHFQSSDPLGLNEWSSRLSVRGFSQTYLGYTLDGIPLGDSAYAAHNGLGIGRAIIAEDLGRVTLSQGAGALGTASTSNLGGTVQFFSDDPENKLGVRAAQTVGSNNAYRTYGRFDTGLLENGTKAYVSAVHQQSDNWKGGGRQELDQVNAKVVHIFDANRLSLFYNQSDRRETDYQEISKEMVGRLGWGWDNYYPNWQRAVDAANGIYSGNVNSWDDAYWTSTTLRTDKLGGASLDLKLSDAARLKTTAYGQTSKAEGQWWALQGVPSPSGVPFSTLARTYHINRQGVTSDLTWKLSNQEIKTGVWFERTKLDWNQSFYDAGSQGDGLSYASNPFATTDAQNFTTNTRQFYLQDTISFLDERAKATIGFKSSHVGTDAQTTAGSRADGSITASKSFLPQVGINYQLSKRDEVFASYSENMKAYTAGPWGPFMVSQAIFDASSLRPETSKTYELGYRYRQKDLQGSVTVYNTEFKDRLLVVSNCILLGSCASTLANVGKVESRGIEAALAWNPVRNWTWFNALTFNDSKYKSDYVNGATTIATKGKYVVDSPRRLFNTTLSYDNGSWFGSLNGKFTDKRYYTYQNDSTVPAYVVWNASAGYKQKNFIGLSDFAVQLNLANIFNKKYYGTLGTNGFPTSDPSGTFPTSEEGAPRQAFLTVSGKY